MPTVQASTIPSLSQPTVSCWFETSTCPSRKARCPTPEQAQSIIRKLIETYGQSDREQFCVVLLNNKNEVIGLNIVSTGAVSLRPRSSS